MHDHTATVLYRDADMICAVWQRFFLNVWRGDVTDANTDALLDHFHRALTTTTGQVAMMVVITPTAGIPSRALRARHAAAIRDHADHIRSLAHVVESSGFQGRIVRTVLHTIYSLTRSDFERAVFPDIRRASVWLTPRATLGVNAEQLETIVRRALEAPLAPDHPPNPPTSI